jgi:amino-acid N-acetyltransferase
MTGGSEVAIGPARPEDLPALVALLRAAELPPDDLESHLSTVLVARQGAQIVGSAALELYGESALLRSVAVDGTMRGRGLGVDLTRAALELARANRVTRVYLLTETAEGFFPRFGFREVARSEIPSAVTGSVEFTTVCPETAPAMLLELT